MVQEYSRELWAKETRSRGLSTVMISNAALFTFFMLFRESLAPKMVFDGLFVCGLLIQIWRTFFHLRFSGLNDELWLKWNDRSLATFAVFWFCFSTAVAVCSSVADAKLNAFMMVLLVGYLSSSSQFFVYNRKLFLFFVACVALPGTWLASKFSDVMYLRVLLGFLPLVYGAVQIKTRRTLWDAMFSVSRSQSLMKRAVDSLPAGLSVIRGGSYEIVNAYSARLVGLPAADMIGKPVGFSKQSGEFASLISEFMRGGETLESFEASVETEDGPRAHLVLLHRDSLHRNELIVSCLDIDSLSRAQDDLEQERTRVANLSEFSVRFAGEIASPLAALTEQVLVKQAPDLEQARDQIRRIQLVINRMKSA